MNLLGGPVRGHFLAVANGSKARMALTRIMRMLLYGPTSALGNAAWSIGRSRKGSISLDEGHAQGGGAVLDGRPVLVGEATGPDTFRTAHDATISGLCVAQERRG